MTSADRITRRVAIALLLVVSVGAASYLTGIPSILSSSTNIGTAASGAFNGTGTILYGDTNFSQGGLRYCSGATPNCKFGVFVNYDGIDHQMNFYNYDGDQDRMELWNGDGGMLWLQPTHGYVAIGPEGGSHPRLFNVMGGSVLIADASSGVASESLTNGALTSGTSWTSTGDAALTANAATWTFSAGTASTIQQASGTLAIAGVNSRTYVLTYDASAISGSPQVKISSAFCNALTFNTCFLTSRNDNTLKAGNGQKIRFQAVAAPGNFVLTATLTSGQAFTLDNLSLKEVTAGEVYAGGSVDAAGFKVKGSAGFTGTASTNTGSCTVKGGLIISCP